MKTFITFLLVSILYSVTHTQPNHELDVLRLGYGIAEEQSGLNIAVEARSFVFNNFSIGAELHSQRLNYGKEWADVGSANTIAGLFNVDFYSSKTNKYRSFVGIGLGALYYHEDLVDISFSSTVSDINIVSMGISPRVGHAFNKLRLTLNLNLIPHSQIPSYWNLSAAYTLRPGS